MCLVKIKGYLDWYHCNSSNFEMYHYNSRNLKYTIATLRFAEPYHCLRMLAAWAHSQTYEYHTYFSMDISAPDSILIDPLRSGQWTDPFSPSRDFSPSRSVQHARRPVAASPHRPVPPQRGHRSPPSPHHPMPQSPALVGHQGAGAGPRCWRRRRARPAAMADPTEDASEESMDLDPLLLCLQSMHGCKWVEELRCADPSVFCRFFSC